MMPTNTPGLYEITDEDIEAAVESLLSRKLGDPDAPMPTWGQLVAAEPRLGHLLTEIGEFHPGGEGFCANRLWYQTGGFRDRMSKLAGWHAESDNAVVHGDRAFDVACHELYGALPDCQHEDSGCYW